MDISGYQQLELDHNVFKQRLEPDGSPKLPKEQHPIGEDGLVCVDACAIV